MIKMEFDAKNLEVRLSGLSGALKDLRPVWGDVHQIFLDFMKRVFASEGAYSGNAWVPLNPSYAAWKQRHYPNMPILQRTGAMYRSFTSERDPSHVYRTGPSFMETGSSVEYARAHQWGYSQKNLPARPIIQEFTRAEGARAADAVLAYLLKSMRTGPGPRRN